MPLNAVVSVCLIVGEILALRPSLASRQFLTAAMIASIPIDLVLMTIGVLVQLDILEIMEHSMPTSDIPEEPFLRIFRMIGMAFGVLFGLKKLVYYGWGVAILRGEKVKSWNH